VKLTDCAEQVEAKEATMALMRESHHCSVELLHRRGDSNLEEGLEEGSGVERSY
jgi:hypothetical protein